MSTQNTNYQTPQVVVITFDTENSLCITGSGMPEFDPIELDF